MYKILIFLSSVFLLAGCATAPPEEKMPEYVWPSPPAPPRIKWIAEYARKSDLDKGPTGMFAAVLGGKDDFGLSKPSGIVADSSGNIYVADTDLRTVFVFDLEKKRMRLIGRGTLGAPVGVAIDNSTGILYVTDSRFSKVFGFNKNNGMPVLSFGEPGKSKNLSGIAVDEAKDRLYVSDTQNHSVRVFTKKGTPLFTIGKRGKENGEFNFPSFLAVDKKGNLYVSDSFNFRVQIFDSEGRFIRTFGSVGDVSGTFTRLKGIGVDSDGNIYAVDAAFGNFQIFNQEGKLLLAVGEGGSEPGKFYLPTGMFIDDKDRIYVSDTANARIQVFQYLKVK